MILTLKPAHLAIIEEHCVLAYPNEACGILIGRREEETASLTTVLLTANDQAPAFQHHRYRIPPEELLRAELLAEEQALTVIGYFHSHPDLPAVPSEHDLENAWPDYLYLITSVKDRRATETRGWWLGGDCVFVKTLLTVA